MMSFNQIITIRTALLHDLPTVENMVEVWTIEQMSQSLADPKYSLPDFDGWMSHMEKMRPFMQWGRNEFIATLSIAKDGDGFSFVSPVSNRHAEMWKNIFFQELEERYPHYGVFSHPEPTNREEPSPAGFRCSPQGKHTRNTPCREDRPALGKRRLYKSNAYLTHARRLSVGLEERREDGTCDIWLSEEERALVCKSSNTGRQS